MAIPEILTDILSKIQKGKGANFSSTVPVAPTSDPNIAVEFVKERLKKGQEAYEKAVYEPQREAQRKLGIPEEKRHLVDPLGFVGALESLGPRASRIITEAQKRGVATPQTV